MIESFLQSDIPLIDVRSPCEYHHGHIPTAHNLPLFSNEERTLIGTLYKKQGKMAAIRKGLDLVGPRLSMLVDLAQEIAPQKKARLYCARGGLRSSSVKWLLETAGINCLQLNFGYKTFRKWVLQQFTKDYPLIVLGGLTGSGKTQILKELHQAGEQTIDLEELAHHCGSSFGHLGKQEQPSTEHFENLLAIQLHKTSKQKPIWIEDESRMIGLCHLPPLIWNQMSKAPFIWLETSKEERIQRLLSQYGSYPLEDLILATRRLTKKIGIQKTKQIIEALEAHQISFALSLILDYYDKTYTYSCQKRHPSKKNLSSQDFTISSLLQIASEM